MSTLILLQQEHPQLGMAAAHPTAPNSSPVCMQEKRNPELLSQRGNESRKM